LKEFFYCNNGFYRSETTGGGFHRRNVSGALRGGVQIYQSAVPSKIICVRCRLFVLRDQRTGSFFGTDLRGLYAQITQFSLGLGTLNDLSRPNTIYRRR